MKRARLGLAIFLLSACSTVAKRHEGAQGDKSATESTAPATPLTREVPTVALVLGPGGAKAMAHEGVIKALQENHIPIARIIGIEWGALVAAAFAAHGQYHEVDWKLYRLDQVDLSAKGGFLSFSRDHSIKIMDGYLHDNFGNMEISAMKVPFSCPTRSFWSGALVWQHKGMVSDALRKCLPFPPLFQIHGGWLAAATQIRDAIESLKAEGYKLIIFVDVLGNATPFEKEKVDQDPTDVLLWQEVQRSVLDAEGIAGEVIRVPTENVLLDRFDQRKELQQAGEQEGVRAAQRLSAKYGF